MRAIKTINDRGEIALQEIDIPQVPKGHCLVKLNYAALNRRDYWITKSLYPGIVPGATLGSDGCGVVVEGSKQWMDKKVLLNPNIDWGNNPKAQSNAYSILGMPVDGTLAEYISIPEHRLAVKPEYLSDAQASALPLSALTAYRACVTKAQISSRSKVLVTGIGGGVAQFAVSISYALGAKVFVTSGSDSKIHKAKAIGAVGGFKYSDENWHKVARKEIGGFDVVIDGAGGESTNSYLKLLNPGGKLVVYGATAGVVPNFDIHRLFWSQVEFLGSTMGNDEEFSAMVQFFDKHKIKPNLDVLVSINDYKEAFARFEHSAHFGKIVLDLS